MNLIILFPNILINYKSMLRNKYLYKLLYLFLKNVHCTTTIHTTFTQTSSSSLILALRSRIKASFSASRSLTLTSSCCKQVTISSFCFNDSSFMDSSSKDDCRDVCYRENHTKNNHFGKEN